MNSLVNDLKELKKMWEEELEKIYCYKDETDNETKNYIKEIKSLESLERVYKETIDNSVKDGTIYTDVYSYYNHVLADKEDFEEKLKDLENKRGADIKNIRLLITAFQKEIEKVENDELI